MGSSDKVRPEQHQNHQPGVESDMQPEPVYDDPKQKGSGRLQGKIALITGGDSGIGRAAAVAFAKEGADVCIVYLEEHADAAETRQSVERYGRSCHLISGDVGDQSFCHQAVAECIERFQGLDVLVNNAAEQHVRESMDELTPEAVERTFRTNIFSMFYLIQSALPHLREGSSIINSTSIVAYQGHPKLLDYAATKGAVLALTRSLAVRLTPQGIRVNAVAPGPVWTPLIPSSFPAEKVAKFGENKPLGRAGQPVEIAPSYVFLASADSSYMSGQVLHPNGGAVVGG